MNQTLNINLGGYPFNMDRDAYEQLDAYLRSLNKHFSKSEGHQEIMADIEARIAELFNEKKGEPKIIGIEEVKNAIRIMGRPEQIEDDTTTADESKPHVHAWSLKTGKRLFRDPEDKVIGGVCSGLAAYFGIKDPLWVRVVFAIVFVTMGIGLIAYLLLWAIVPEAKTAADRLQMAGERANAENIAKVVEKGIEDLTESFKDLGKEFQSKKKSFSRAAGDHRSFSFKKWISLIKKLLRGAINILKNIFYRAAKKADDFV